LPQSKEDALEWFFLKILSLSLLCIGCHIAEKKTAVMPTDQPRTREKTNAPRQKSRSDTRTMENDNTDGVVWKINSCDKEWTWI